MATGGGWRLVSGWLTAGGGWLRLLRLLRLAGGGWRSRRAAGGRRSWATRRGQFCGGTIHETAKTTPNTQNSRSSSTKTPILCSKCPKMGVSKGKSAQKPRFCAQNARKRGFRSQKKHKNLNFVLKTPENGGFGSQKSTKTPILCSGRRGLAVGRENIGIGKRNRGLPANHRARFQNANAS